MTGGKDILLVSYYFPPLGMGGVGRPYALAKCLPEHGYRVHVLTVKNIMYPAYDYAPLESLDRDLIYRTGSLDPSRLLYLLGKRKQKQPGYPGITGRLPVYLPDLKRGWNYFAIRRAGRVIKRHKVSTVITTSPPVSSHLIGLKLKLKYGIKWIADFRDFWFPLPIEKAYRQGFTRNYSLRLKDMIVRNADAIVAVNEDIRDYLGRGEVIYNGADESAAEFWKRGFRKEGNSFTIGLLGTFNELVPIEPLLAAVRRIIDAEKEGGRKIYLKHAGQSDNSMRAQIKKYDLIDRVELMGYLPKEEAMVSLAPCNVLYLALKNTAPYHILPGRTFELMMSGKPIVGLVPHDSAVGRLLREYPAGIVIDDMSIDRLAEVIIAIMNEQVSSNVLIDANLAYKYSSRRMADDYASLIGGLV